MFTIKKKLRIRNMIKFFLLLKKMGAVCSVAIWSSAIFTALPLVNFATGSQRGRQR